MENGIFRKKSLERISSPEQLNDYIKVSNPSIWIVLLAIIIFFVAVFIWSINGNIISKIDSKGIFIGADNELYVACYVPSSEVKNEKVRVGMEVRLYDADDTSNSQSYLTGKVMAINPSSETISDIKKSFSDAWLSDKMVSNLKEGYGNLLSIRLVKDENSNDGYKWEGESSHSLDIKNNNLCRVEVIKESITPINFIIG